VHRDVKPANVVVGRDARVTVLDLGVVRDTSESDLTRPGALLGTPYYMSPEQIGGRALDGRADLFAVGVCLYELVTGVHPFRRNHELATFNAILDEQPAPLSKWTVSSPAELEEVIRGALAKTRDGRYPSARVMYQALRAVPELVDRAAVAALVRTVYTSPLEPASLPTWAVDAETEPVRPDEPGLDQDLTLRAPDDSFDGHTLVDGARSSGEHDTAVSAAVPLPEGLDATLPPPAPRGPVTRRAHGIVASGTPAANTLDQTLPPPDPIATTAPTLPPALRALRVRPPLTPEPARPSSPPTAQSGLHLLLLLLLIVLLLVSLVALWTGRLDGLLPWTSRAR
jgi:serine/threonine protein kinase